MSALTRGIGKQLSVGIAREITRGTVNTTVGVIWIEADDWNVDEKYKNAVDVQTYGVIEDNASQTRVKNYAEGTLKVPLTDRAFPLFLYAMFGTDTTSLIAGESAVYAHAFSVQQGVQHQSITLMIHDPITAVDYYHALGVPTKIDLDYSLGKFIEASIGIKALKGVTTVLVPTQTVENRFVPQYLTFKTAANYAGLGAASAIKLKSAKISFNPNIEDDDVMGSTSPRDYLNKEFSVDGSLEAIWQNESDFKTNSLANTAQALRFSLVNSDTTIGVATNPSCQIDFTKVFFTEFSRPLKLKDVVYQTIKWKASYSISDAFMVKATSVLALSGY
jgi:hypothetical protein